MNELPLPRSYRESPSEVDDMTEEERQQLERIRAIQKDAWELVERKLSDIHQLAMNGEYEIDTLLNFLDGEERKSLPAHISAPKGTTASDDKEGICPVCGGQVWYTGRHQFDDSGGTYWWVCPHCGASGEEGYNRAFDRHYNVADKDGNPVPGRPE